MNRALLRVLRSRALVASFFFAIASMVSGFLSFMVSGPTISSATFAPNPIPIAGATVHVTAKVTDSTSALSHVKVRVLDLNGNIASDTAAQVGQDGVTYSADVPVSANTSNAKDGSKLYFYADDVAGNNSGYILVATQGHDSTPPVISNALASPNPIPIKGATIHLSAKVVDASLPIQYVRAVVRDSGGNLVSQTNASVGLDGFTYTADVTVPANLSNADDGKKVSLVAADTANNVSTEVLVDSQGHDATPPVITNAVASPNPIPVPGATIHVSGKVTDASLSVQYVKVVIRSSGGNLVSQTTAAVGSDGFTYTADVTVPANLSNTDDGKRIYLVAADTANNLSTELLVDSQGHDSTPPDISNAVASPNPVPIKGGTIHVSAKVTDGALSVQYVRVVVRDSGGNLASQANASVGLDGFTYSADVTVPANLSKTDDGKRIYIVAADTANNVSSEFLVDSQGHDTTPPDISGIVYSPNPIPISGGTVHISAIAVDASLSVSTVVFNVRDASGNVVRSVTGQVGTDGKTYSADVPVDANTRTDRIGESIYVTATDTAGNAGTVLGAFQDNRPHLSGFTLNPASVAGGTSAAGTVTLDNPALTGGFVVNLASDNLAATVPASVTVVAGATQATFTVTTAPVPSAIFAKLTASAGTASLTQSLGITPSAISSLSLSPAFVFGGDGSTGTVTLSGPAPVGGTTVSLASNNLAAAVPPSVTFPAGASSATFAVTTTAVTSNVSATISAKLNGVTKAAKLGVDAPLLTSLITVPPSVYGGANSTGTVTLTGIAPTGGSVVNLASDSAFASVPATVTVAAGSKTATFTVTTQPVATTGVATLSATFGTVTRSAKLTVNAPYLVSETLSPATVLGGVSSTGTVTLNSVAPTGGLAVSLGSDSAFAGVPASVVVPAGTKTATFVVTTKGVASASVATLTATMGAVSKTAKLNVSAATLSALRLSTVSVFGGTSLTGTLTLTGVAPDAGLSVALGSDSAFASVPASVSVAGGATTASFTITTTPVSSDSTATLTATLGSVSKTASLGVKAPVLYLFGIAPTSVKGGTSVNATVTLNSPAASAGTVVSLSSDSTYATVPASVTVPAGAKLGKFTITTKAVGTSSSAVISATLGSVTKTASLTVLPPSLSALSVSPTFLYGGSTSVGTVTLSDPAPDAGFVLNLSSDSPFATVPANVTVAGGAKTATFNVTTVPIATAGTATISASDGTVSKTASLTVNPTKLTGIALSPTAVVGGSSSTATITLSSAAPTGGTSVMLASDSTSATVPSSATVAAGATTATFSITTSVVTSVTTANVSATLGSDTSSTALTINVAPTMALTLSPNSIEGGNVSTGTITLGAAAPAGGQAVRITSSNFYAFVPSSVTVPAGATTATFAVQTPAVGAYKTATITAVGIGNATLTIAPSGYQAGAPWPARGRNSRRTGYGLGSGSNGTLKWSFATGASVHSSPTVGADGTIYVGSDDQSVYALDGATGVKKWSFSTGKYVYSCPSIGIDGTVYIGSNDNNVYALDGATGAKKWSFATGSFVYSSPAIGSDGTVYVGSSDESVYALDGATGAKKWSFATGWLVESSPTIGPDGTVYIGSGDGNVYALDGATGTKKWSFAIGVYINSSPAIGADGTVYIGSFDHNVYALDGSTGTKKWSFATGSGVVSSPAIGADGTVYIGSQDNSVYALDGATGAKKWSFATGSYVESSPATGSDGTVYVGSFDHNVYALDGSTGTKKWSFATGDLIVSSPAIGADGTVYVGSYDGKVYALGTSSPWPMHNHDTRHSGRGVGSGSNGTLKWSFATGSGVYSSPAIGADGTVYIGSEDNSVYALDGATGAKKWSFATSSYVYSSPAIGADGTVYIGSEDNNVYALDGATGAKKWSFATGDIVESSPAIGADGTVYIGSVDNSVYALDCTTGAKKWSFATGSGVYSSLAIGADGTVYVGSFDHSVYALDGTTGAKKWSFATGYFIYSSPAIGADGTVYVGSFDHSVYALGTTTPSPKQKPRNSRALLGRKAESKTK